MDRAVIIAPFRTDHGRRQFVWETIVRPFYQTSGYEMFEGDDPFPGKMFSISRANNALARQAGPWDVAFFIGADCIVPRASLDRGIAYAREHQVVTLPHDQFFQMEREAIGAPWAKELPFGHEEEWVRHSRHKWSPNGKLYAPSGVLVMPREVWERIGGYDDRFEGWGFEDAALLYAVSEFHRLSGPLYHYWHPVHDGRLRSIESTQIWRTEYRNAMPVPRQFLADEIRWLGGQEFIGAWSDEVALPYMGPISRPDYVRRPRPIPWKGTY